jgi:hypothetical protein
LDQQPKRPDDALESPDGAAPEEPALTFGEWLKANAFVLITVAIVVVILLRNFDT